MTQIPKLGKLSPERLRVLVDAVPWIDRLRSETAHLVDTRSIKDSGVTSTRTNYAILYEIPFGLHLSVFLHAVGLADWVTEISKEPDPTGRAIEFLSAAITGLDSAGPDVKTQLRPVELLPLVNTVACSLDCVMLHQRYMNELVAEARKGNIPSLLKVLRLDRDAALCPSIARLLTQAYLRSDQKLLRLIVGALGGPSRREAHYLRTVKLSMQALRDAGASSLRNEELAELFVRHLKIYAETEKSDPGKALQKHWQKSKR